MAMDSNWFDDFLKAKLYRDLAFRAVIWTGISATAMALALRNDGSDVAKVFSSMAESITPVVNLVGTIALLAALAALMFKDIEYADPSKFGQTTGIGRFGGVVRRTAGDLTLWTLGAFVSLLTAAGIATVRLRIEDRITLMETGGLTFLLVLVLVMIVILAIVNVFVRRRAPPIASNERVPSFLRRPAILIAGYGVAFTIVAGRLALG